jgi:hypothetical protein
LVLPPLKDKGIEGSLEEARRGKEALARAVERNEA